MGTKKQAQEAVEEHAKRCGMPYVNNRWLGGTLTNWSTIKRRIDRMKELESMQTDGLFEGVSKKDATRLRHEYEKLLRTLDGLHDMRGLPSFVYIIDPRKREHLGIREANRLGIPIVAIVDTNCDPDEIQHVIPGNDDAIRSGNLISKIIANAVLEGLEARAGMQASAAAAAAGDRGRDSRGQAERERESRGKGGFPKDAKELKEAMTAATADAAADTAGAEGKSE